MSLYVLTVIHYTKKPLWRGLRAALFYGHRDASLESSLTPCPLRKIAVVIPPLEPTSSAATGSWGRFAVLGCVSSWQERAGEAHLKSNPKVVTWNYGG